MRYANNPEVMKINNEFVGIDLGADFCAEHEWGIKGIVREFGVDGNKVGIDGRMVTVVPKSLIYKDVTYENMKCHLLALVPYYYREEDLKSISTSFRRSEDENIRNYVLCIIFTYVSLL